MEGPYLNNIELDAHLLRSHLLLYRFIHTPDTDTETAEMRLLRELTHAMDEDLLCAMERLLEHHTYEQPDGLHPDQLAMVYPAQAFANKLKHLCCVRLRTGLRACITRL